MSSDLVSGLASAAQQLWNEPEASLASGILFGSQGHLSNELTNALRVTGTLHIIAVSGQNMSILGGFVGRTSHIFGWKISLLVQGLAILGYIFLVGGGASVVRSGAMALIALFAQATGRQRDSGRALLAAALVMIIFHSAYLQDIGWELSVVATAGIIWIAPLLNLWLKRLPEFVAATLAISLAAQLATWPIIAANFHTFSVVSLLANALVEWSVPWIMGLGAIAVLTYSVLPLVGVAFSWLAVVPLTYFVSVIYLLARVPGASISLIGFPLGLAIIYYTVLAGIIWKWRSVKAS